MHSEELTPVFVPTLANTPEQDAAVAVDKSGKGKNIRAITGNGLTIRETLFCQNYCKSANGMQAVMETWDIVGEANRPNKHGKVRSQRDIEHAAEQRATLLLYREDIRNEIRKILSATVTTEYVNSKIKSIAETAKSTETQLKAAIALGKFLNMGEGVGQRGGGVSININLPEPKQVPIREVVADDVANPSQDQG